ncbi:MAG TPA: hypothetical protein VGF75_00470 [Candidatus Saccharimonadales bacterium]|jgi:NTP pyrophosphatase (non-canonical NTP hydrolase)
MTDHIIQTVSDYVNWTETTAIYPRNDIEQSRNYEFLGVYSEIGEVCGMLKRELRDPDYTLERLSLKKELGDIAWYLARLHYDHNEKNEKIEEILINTGIEKPESMNCFSIAYSIWKYFQPLCATDTAVIKAVTGLTHESCPDLEEALSKVETRMTGLTHHEAARVALILDFSKDYKKPIGFFMSDFVEECCSSIGLVKWFILCDRYRFEPLDVMRTNYRKLEDRKERDKLHGSGDTR